MLHQQLRASHSDGDKTDFKVLDESPNNTPTAEETALFTAAGASRCIQVFVPETFEQGGVISKSISGGGATYDGGAANAKVVVVECTVSEVVAHELGHATGFGGHDGNPTVMKPTGAHNVPNSTAVSKDVCTRARTGGTLGHNRRNRRLLHGSPLTVIAGVVAPQPLPLFWQLVAPVCYRRRSVR